MGSEELSLAWEDHNETLVGVFERLLESSTFVDCTIAAEGQYLKAHKIVLSASSPYFELLFRQEQEKNPIVVFKDVKFQDLRSIVDYVYRGKVKIPHDRLADFIEAAESLQIIGLSGSHGKKISGKEKQKSSLAQRRGSHTSSTSHKRLRKSSSFPAEKKSGGVSPRTDKNDENDSSESEQMETSVDISSPQPQLLCYSMNRSSDAQRVHCEDASNVEVQSSSLYMLPVLLPAEKLLENAETVVKTESLSASEISVPESECSADGSEDYTEERAQFCNDDETINNFTSTVEVQASSSHMQPVLLPTEKSIEDIATVIKVEPETMTEVFVPENGCSMDKNEEYEREMRSLNNDDGNIMSLAIKRNANQYSVSPDASEDEGVASCFSQGATPPGVCPEAEHDVSRAIDAPNIALSACAAVRGGGAEVDSPAGTRRTPRGTVGPRRVGGPEGEQPTAGPSKAAVGRRHNSKRLFRCAECNNTFAKFTDLENHLCERPLTCEQCGKFFRNPRSIKTHVQIHSGERRQMCAPCGKSFTNWESLHVNLIHPGERPFKCEQCGKAFKQKANLQTHFRTHTGERPFKCEFCGKTFRHWASHNAHRRIHTGERPFACERCGKTFTQKIHLLTHFRTHTGERPYKCDQCGRMFVQKIHLLKHFRTHTGERPYCCNMCGKRFTTGGNLQKHKRIHTRKESYGYVYKKRAYNTDTKTTLAHSQ